MSTRRPKATLPPPAKREEILALHAEGIGPAAIAVRLGLLRKSVMRVLAEAGATEKRVLGERGSVREAVVARDKTWQARGFWRPT